MENLALQAELLRDEYLLKRSGYCGKPMSDHRVIDTELVSQTILDLHCGKAPDITVLQDSLPNIWYIVSHLVSQSVSIVLAKLFQLIGRFHSGVITDVNRDVRHICSQAAG